MNDWVKLVSAGLLVASCGGRVGDTAEVGGNGAGGGGQGIGGANSAGTSGAGGNAGSAAGASGSKDVSNACVAFPAAGPPTASADPLVTYVFDALFVGDVDWTGKGDGNAWQFVGRDLDGTTSTGAKDTPCAKPGNGGAVEDGSCGQDNTLGRGYYASSSYHTKRIRDGAFSVTLQIDPVVLAGGVSKRGSLAPLRARAQPPLLDGSDVWIPDVDAYPPAPANFWTTSFVRDGKLFLKAPSAAVLIIRSEPKASYDNGPLVFVLSQVEVVADLSSDAQRLTHGVVAGMVDPSFLNKWDKAASCVSGQPQDLDFTQWVDISANSSNPGACNLVSVGFGFEAVRGSLSAPASSPAYAPTCGKPP